MTLRSRVLIAEEDPCKITIIKVSNGGSWLMYAGGVLHGVFETYDDVLGALNDA